VVDKILKPYITFSGAYIDHVVVTRFVSAYIDDLVVTTFDNYFDRHLHELDKVLAAFESSGMPFKLSIYLFAKSQV